MIHSRDGFAINPSELRLYSIDLQRAVVTEPTPRVYTANNDLNGVVCTLEIGPTLHNPGAEFVRVDEADALVFIRTETAAVLYQHACAKMASPMGQIEYGE